MSSNNIIPQYEPSSDELRYMLERVQYLESSKTHTVQETDELLTQYLNYKRAINRDRLAWKIKNAHLLPPDSDEEQKTVITSDGFLNPIPPEECYYFKYGNINYQQEALYSSDPAAFSLRYGGSEVIRNCYHALPDDLRRSESQLLRFCEGWMFSRDMPKQEELRAWIKGKSDDKYCCELVRMYIGTAADKCYVKGLSTEKK